MNVFSEALNEGRSFFLSDYAAIGGTATRTLMLQTPGSGRLVTLYLDVYADEEVTVELYEASTHNAGTGLTERNRDRSSAFAASTVITHTVSGGANGTLIMKHKTANNGTVPPTAVGGAPSQSQAILLKRSTKYLVLLTAGADDVKVTTQFNWTETPRWAITTTTTTTTSTTTA